MPPFGPISRAQPVASRRRLGFQGSYPGSKHQSMVREAGRLRIPNPHRGDVGRDLLARLLRQAAIPRDEWDAL